MFFFHLSKQERFKFSLRNATWSKLLLIIKPKKQSSVLDAENKLQ